MNTGAIWGVATQSVKIGDETATFSVNPLDAAVVHLSMTHADGSSTDYVFAHNGGLTSTVETPAPAKATHAAHPAPSAKK